MALGRLKVELPLALQNHLSEQFLQIFKNYITFSKLKK